MHQQYPSRLLEQAVSEISKLPGIGRKTALRLVLHLLRKEAKDVHALSKSLTDLADGVKYCRTCHNISDTDECDICANPSRDRSTICVVENIQNVMAIENTGQFRGPNDLELQSLVDRVASGSIEEIILALNPTMEGDTTNFYIQRKLAGHNVRLSVLARGVSIGDDLEYTDEVTLGRSIINRTILK